MSDFFAAIGVVFLAVAIIFVATLLLVAVFRQGKELDSHATTEEEPNNDLGLGTKLMLGAMGAELLDEHIEKHKRESERKRQELFFWQDAIRDGEDADFDEDGDNEDDDWL